MMRLSLNTTKIFKSSRRSLVNKRFISTSHLSRGHSLILNSYSSSNVKKFTRTYHTTVGTYYAEPWAGVSHEQLAMPALSPTMSEGTLVSWIVKEGEKFSAGDALAEIETDKATVSYEATDDGYLAKILVPEGTTKVTVGAPIAVTVFEAGDVSKFKDYTPSSQKSTDEPAKPQETTNVSSTSNTTNSVKPDCDYSDLSMPALSPTMSEGTLVSWIVKEGEKFSAGDALAEIETDKATVSFEATDDGYLAKIFVPEGTSNVTVGAPIAVTVTQESDIPKVQNYQPGTETSSTTTAPVKETSTTSAPTPTSSQPSVSYSGDRIFVSPIAKKTAESRGIDLTQVKGTGPNSRIILADVAEYVAPDVSRQTVSKASSFKPSSVETSFTDIDVTNIRRVTAERLTFSKQNIPHYYLTVECQVDEIMGVREELNGLVQKDGVKLSMNDFIIKACAKALLDVPEVNSEWRGDIIRRYHSADINVAVNTDSGLYTPLVKHADKKGLAEISKTVKSLAEKAKTGTIGLHEIQPGTFTISNLGMLGISEFSAVINPPQACILAVGTVDDKVIVAQKLTDNAEDNEYEIETKKVMKVTLSCDHRVVDGAVGAKWLQSFKDYIENPLKLLL